MESAQRKKSPKISPIWHKSRYNGGWMSDFITNAFDRGSEALSDFLADQNNIGQIKSAIDTLVDCLKKEGHIFSCGNGGSMCDSMHFAEELSGRYRKDRHPLPATAISDPGHLSCVANDYGYDQVFSRYLTAWMNKNSALVAISTSGKSKNIIQATLAAKAKGATTIALLGKDGGEVRDLAEIPIVVPSYITDRIQEIHIKIIHIFIEGIDGPFSLIIMFKHNDKTLVSPLETN